MTHRITRDFASAERRCTSKRTPEKPQLNKAGMSFVCKAVSVVRQNSWADVVAVVITLGLTGSRWLSSYKPRAKAEGETQTSEQQETVTPPCCHTETESERGSECWGKSRLSQCKVIKPTHRERERASGNCKRRGKQSRRRIASGITDNTCWFYAASQLFQTTSQEQFAAADVPLSVNRIWIDIKKTQDLKDLADGLHENTQTVLIRDQFCSSSPKFLAFLLLDFQDDVIIRQDIISIQCSLVIFQRGGEQAVPPKQGRIGSKAGLWCLIHSHRIENTHTC